MSRELCLNFSSEQAIDKGQYDTNLSSKELVIIINNKEYDT